MLISLSKKFVFIAGMKTASTAIESALKPDAQLALIEARFGKHQPFSEVEARFAWLLSRIDPGELFVFGVMRDPIDYMISLYNSHADRKFKESPGLYTADLDFDRFLNEWTQRNSDQIMQQYSRFLDRNGRIAADYIISYNQLENGLRFVGERIGVKGLTSLRKENESPARADRSSLTAEQRNWIEHHFAEDRELLNNYCDRSLTPRVHVLSSNLSAAGPDGANRSGTPDEIIDILYHATLRRPPDPIGRATYAALLRAGRSELELVKLLAGSAEFAANRLIPA
jgi:hypothetical protein